MEKTKEQLIQDYKKANSERKQKLAEKHGFKTGADYLASLMNTPKKEVKKASKMKGIFYVVDVLDASGSMRGGKYENSKKGIINSIKDLKSKTNVKYSLVEFIDSSKYLNKPITNIDSKDVNVDRITFNGAHGIDTPLYWTVCEVIERLKVNPEDKVLINIYTDGGDNGSNSSYTMTQKAASLIKKVQKENFTVTFVATPEDLKNIKRDINIDDSNTLATENTAKGFETSMLKTRSARGAYFASASRGEDVLVGFYKKEGTL